MYLEREIELHVYVCMYIDTQNARTQQKKSAKKHHCLNILSHIHKNTHEAHR